MSFYSFEEQVNDVRQRFTTSKGQESDFHDKLLNLVKRLKDDGKNAIAGRIQDMEHADEIYRAFRVPDEDDKKAEERGEPIKIIYPVTYAQIQASIATIMLATNKTPFFELEARGPHFTRNSKLMELELQYQLENCQWNLIHYQWLLDMFKYGFSIMNISYKQRMSWITQQNPFVKMIPALAHLGIDPTTTKKVVGYEGAHLFVDDPAIANFDPNVSIGNIQQGQYVFTQRKISYNQLKLEAGQGYYFNIENLPKAPATGRDDPTGRPNATGTSITGGAPPVEGGDIIVIDICNVKLCPKDYGLSELDEQQIWEVAMANGCRIISAEPSRFQHGQLPISAIEYSPDLHNTVNEGMAQTIDGLQTITNWLLNTHMESVRQVVDNHFIVDPDGIEIEDIKQRRRFWRLKRGKGSLGVDRFIKQLNQTDVTQQHIGNAHEIIKMIELVTGMSNNQMGQPLLTKRSATEVRSIQTQGSQRMKLMLALLHEQGYQPLGTQMIANTQQFMSTQRFLKLNQSSGMQLGLDPRLIQGGMIGLSPEDIQGQFMIKMGDNGMPQDKQGMANVLKELAMAAMQNPVMIQAFGINMPQVLTQMLVNYGIKNTTDFIQAPPPDVMNAMIQMSIMKAGAQKGGQPAMQAQVMPDEMVAKEVQKGNLTPFGAKPGASNERPTAY